MNLGSLFNWGKDEKLQEVTWDGRNTDGLDTVLVATKRVPCAPGLRFTDQEAVKLSRRCGWILGFGKVEELDRQGVYLDWVPKSAMEPKLNFFANCLLKLEEQRSSEKILLNEDQRKKFAEDLCAELISPTGLSPETLTRDGYFALKKIEELRTTQAILVEGKKKEFADLKALPPIIVTPLAMKELTDKNDFLEFENAHEKSSISFNPVFKNLCSTGLDSQIHIEYGEIIGELSNISLDHDITVGTMHSIMDQTHISEPDPEDVTALSSMLEENVDRAQKAVQKMNQHKTQLATARNNLEESALSIQTNYDALSVTIAERNKSIALQAAEISRIKREIEMVTSNKDEEISQLSKDLEDARRETEILKKENRSMVPASVLYETEDENTELQEKNSDLQEKLNSQTRRQKSLQGRLDTLKIEAEAKIQALKHENQTLGIKKENLEKTLKEEKRDLASKQEELLRVKKECEELRLQNDNLELSMNKMVSETRRLSSAKTDYDNYRRTSSQRSDDVFHSPGKTLNNTGLVKKMIAPETFTPDFICADGNDGKPDKTKTVQHLLPKWSVGEDIRNYTKRLQHAWEFVKGEFDQRKFCNLVRISVSSNLGEIIDNYFQETDETDINLEGLCKVLNQKLDKRPSEYITDFKMATKGATESYSAYAHRLRELYKKGTELADGKMGSGEKRLLVEQFLEGIPYSESSTLKLVATDAEMMDVDALAIRASRTSKPRKQVSTISGQKVITKAVPENLNTSRGPKNNPPVLRRRGGRFNCHFCNRFGHGWRACFRRAREDPNWQPTKGNTSQSVNRTKPSPNNNI